MDQSVDISTASDIKFHVQFQVSKENSDLICFY